MGAVRLPKILVLTIDDFVSAQAPGPKFANYGENGGPSKPSSLVRFFPISQYLLEPAFGVWALECGVLTSPRA